MLIFFNFSNKYWKYLYLNNKKQYHRLDGPTAENIKGCQWWYKNDMLHRNNGPAYCEQNGKYHYWLNNQKLTEDKYWAIIRFGIFV